MNLKDKVVLITGASSGIGKALALKLFAQEAKLILIARREERLQEVANTLKDPNRVIVVRADVTQKEELETAVRLGIEKYKRLDVIINNAGLGYFGPVESMDMEVFDRVVQTNIYGVLHTVQVSVPFLKKTQGMVVNISSGLSKRALPYLTAYASTKAMVDALSDGMRLELRKHGIKVLNYCPPETETEFFEHTIRGFEMNPEWNPRKMAKAEEVAGRIVEAMRQDKREVVEGSFLKVMNFFAPKVLDNMFYKGMVLKLDKN